MIVDRTTELLRELYGETMNDIVIERIVIGLFFTGVKLSDGSAGVAYTPRDGLHDATCCASMATGTIDELLAYTKPEAKVIVTGPTASILPDVFFERNVTAVSGVRVTDPDLALDLLAEGAGACHLFDVCIRKINTLRG